MIWPKKLLLTIACSIIFCTLIFAQTKSVTGTVKDSDGLPLSRVTVQVKGSSVATTTNADGSFSINPGNSKTLLFSLIGMETRSVVGGYFMKLLYNKMAGKN